MNYTDPSYPAYPPQYYKDPKNALCSFWAEPL